MTERKCAKSLYDRNLDFVRKYKENKGCQSCGHSFPHYILDFDHLGNKQFNVSRIAGSRYKLSKIMEEIGKCEVICANCHKQRTWDRAHL